ncbi:MAG: LLM class F420-dependent oxidoreductase [Jatrophihabitantaceae bacterium]
MSLGLTIPQTGLSLPEHAELIRALPACGYTDVWSAEAGGVDAFTPLALAAAWQPELRLGTAIVPVFTRGPALIAQSAASLAAAAPGRFSLGLGASSPAIVQRWNGIEFDQPYRRARDVLRFVKQALAGELIDQAYDTFTIHRFRLEQPPAEPVPVLLAGLRPGMLALAGREADGAILNWLAAEDVPRCVAAVANPASRIVARIFVCATDDAEYARALARRMIAGYLTVDAYEQFHRWLGRAESLGELWRLWAAGERKAAVAAVPDEVADALVPHGSAASCVAQLRAYREAGVQLPVLAVLPGPEPLDLDGWLDLLAALGGPS